MSRKKKNNSHPVECIAFLAVHCPLQQVEWREKKQEKVIREYAKAHNIKIVGIARTHGFGQRDVNATFERILSLLYKDKVQGVIVTGMDVLSDDLVYQYMCVGEVHKAGGLIYSVKDDSMLKLSIREV